MSVTTRTDKEKIKKDLVLQLKDEKAFWSYSGDSVNEKNIGDDQLIDL